MERVLVVIRLSLLSWHAHLSGLAREQIRNKLLVSILWGCRHKLSLRLFMHYVFTHESQGMNTITASFHSVRRRPHAISTLYIFWEGFQQEFRAWQFVPVWWKDFSAQALLLCMRRTGYAKEAHHQATATPSTKVFNKRVEVCEGRILLQQDTITSSPLFFFFGSV